MNRRDFLKKAALAGVGSAGLLHCLGGLTAAAAPEPGKAELIVTRGGEPEALLDAALKAFGGLGRVVVPGGDVVIKANFTWYGPPEQACNTNPELLAALTRACLQAGAARVKVVDMTIDPAAMTMEISGIRQAVQAAGGEIYDLRKKQVTVVNDTVLGRIGIYREALEAACLINVPILKHHGGAGMSGALKGLMGLTPDRKKPHVVGIDRGIVALAGIIHPHLQIIDAYRALKTRGPQGPGKVVTLKHLIITTDPVAGDAYGASLLGFNPPYIAMAGKAGLGCSDLGRLKISIVDV